MLQGTLGIEIDAEVKGSWELPPSPAWSVPGSCGRAGALLQLRRPLLLSSGICEKVMINAAIADGEAWCWCATLPCVCVPPVFSLHSPLSLRAAEDQGVSFSSTECTWMPLHGSSACLCGDGGVQLRSSTKYESFWVTKYFFWLVTP